jgi:AraC family transcriptional activator of tynA and feaB
MVTAPYAIKRWSTDDVPPGDRLDYFASAYAEAILPMTIDNADPQRFNAEFTVARLDEIEICTHVGSPHICIRGQSEIARTLEAKFSLVLMKDSSFTAVHRVRFKLLPGDILFHDSRYPHAGDTRQPFNSTIVTVTESWLRRWLPNPGVLVGHIPGNSAWGSVLSSYIAALSPEVNAISVLPPRVLTDQLGGLLALTASQARGGSVAPFTPPLRALHERILDCIAQRCMESQLTAADVAGSLSISPRTLHRALASAQQTFGSNLISARIRVAERMLTSPLFNRVTTAEVGRRAGFMSPSHFARVIVKHTGRTPLQLRQSRADSKRKGSLDTKEEPG